jgi:hypothetical protein
MDNFSRLRQYISKASFGVVADRDAALRCVMELAMQSHAIYGVRRYCAEVQETGAQSERAIARDVSRMLAEPPLPTWKTPVVHDCGEEPRT